MDSVIAPRIQVHVLNYKVNTFEVMETRGYTLESLKYWNKAASRYLTNNT
jgi:hypothetical protein